MIGLVLGAETGNYNFVYLPQILIFNIYELS